MKPETRAALLVVAGLLFLANGAWLYPTGPERSYRYTATYEAESIDRVPDPSWGETATGVEYHDCAESVDRPCALSEYVASEGPVRVDAVADPPLYGPDYVTLTNGRHYQTVARLDAGRLVVDLAPIPSDQLARRLAVNYSDARSVVGAAVANGTTTRTVPPADRDYLPGPTYVDRNGTVYYVSVAETQQTPVGWGWKTPPGWVVDLLRLTGWLGGATLLVGAGRASAA